MTVTVGACFETRREPLPGMRPKPEADKACGNSESPLAEVPPLKQGPTVSIGENWETGSGAKFSVKES